MNCSHCSAEIKENANFCPSCGEKTDFYYQNNNKFIMEKEMELFVSGNSDYYLDKWENAKNPSKYAGWNWAAFFLGIYWVGFRKMYLPQLILMILFILFTFPFEYSIFFLILAIYLGLRGNAMYYNHVIKKVTKITNHVNDDVIKMQLEKEGGYSVWKSVLIPIGLIILVSMLEG